RDPGPLYPLSNDEIVRRPRPTPRNALHQVIVINFQSTRTLWKSLVHSLFACIRRIRGVQAKRELKELRRDYDSTGLRAALQLITPLLRCASFAKHACFQRASDTTQQKKRNGGAARLPPSLSGGML